ncbi:MAG: glycosyltransferase family 4 protein [Bryobacterales bacterium]|nr:glycosyltransferase family 4 protein [Bryobacteraceae bacterium]MDW8353709.1 glycosyltransferase family 4 protein [Bryobacterales bacterium]
MNTFGSSLSRVAVIGNYLPRQCGIATFTTDLCESIVAQYPDLTCLALPVNDRPDGYAYPDRVRFEIAQNDITSYQRAADFLNMNNIEVVCLQHEYGIFGGPAGSHILALLRELRMPVVTTLHTILKEPDPHQRTVMLELIQLSDLLVVMSRRGAEFLRQIYGAPAEKIVFIHHGIPEVPFVDPNFYKDQFGVQGKIVLLTFGLLSPNKGIEYVIEALPAVLEKFPNVVYIVLGATHPHVALREGESYRLRLERLARARKVDRHVIFHNRFVSLEELTEFIGAADIYLTPYLNRAQIVSGTLAYTVGMGKAVVSTPYWYAEELLEDGRGLLVPFRDPSALAERIRALLEHDGERHAMRKRAWLLGREMIWPRVARQYVEVFERARELRATHPRPAFAAVTLEQRPLDLPPLKLDHLRTLTDGTGVLQHAIFTVPNYNEGYTTDDNARALALAVLLEQVGEHFPLAPRYLGFLWHAYNSAVGRFRNFLAYNRDWLEEVGSEDCHGRALWALGLVLGRSQNAGLRGPAARLFDQALPATLEFTSPRAWAFVLIGVDEYLRLFSGDRAAQNAREVLAERLLELYRRNRSPDWRWFEDIVAYDNATLPHALLVAGRGMGRKDMEEAALEALSWLAEVQRAGGDHFVPIGSNGFYRRNGERARFDQQPLDAHAMVSACLEAWRLTGDSGWQKEAQRAFEWFLGRNDLGLPLYDAATGGCRDGLHPDRVNQNEGAESTLSFLMALLEMTMAAGVIDAAKAPLAATAACT